MIIIVFFFLVMGFGAHFFGDQLGLAPGTRTLMPLGSFPWLSMSHKLLDSLDATPVQSTRHTHQIFLLDVWQCAPAVIA